ncbi:MAG: hypothetical protein AB7U25_12085 [Vicinamibacterales bacterium]
MRQGTWTRWTRGVLLASVALAPTLVVACGGGANRNGRPHVDHITLPPHKTWRVVSVQPYEGLEEVELVKVDWPNAQEPTFAFALTREGLNSGDGVCLDHIVEIDTFWAHPIPEGGCEKLATQ